jgi:flagellar basal body-associated protein FliL
MMSTSVSSQFVPIMFLAFLFMVGIAGLMLVVYAADSDEDDYTL